MSKQTAVGYIRVSSAVNAADDKDSVARQLDAISSYAKSQGLDVVQVFEDLAVSGRDRIEDREGFSAMLDYLYGNGAKVILIESPTRLARKVLIQEVAFEKLQEKGIKLVPVSDPEYFTSEDDDPDGMRELMRAILGGLSAFERKGIVKRLRAARDRKSAELGRRIEGRPPFPETVVAAAKKLRRPHRKTGERRSLREISSELAKLGHLSSTGKPFVPESVKRMLGR